MVFALVFLALSGCAAVGTGGNADATAEEVPLEISAPQSLYNNCQSVPLKVTSHIDWSRPPHWDAYGFLRSGGASTGTALPCG